MMTEFHETVTMAHALDGDIDTVRERIADMLPGERRALAAACNMITNDIGLYCEGCGVQLDPRGPFAGPLSGLRGTWHPECARAARNTHNRSGTTTGA